MSSFVVKTALYFGLAAAILPVVGMCSRAAAAAPATPALNAVQYNYSVEFAAGATSERLTVTPVTPTGKVLVIQNIGIYRYPANSATLQTFLAVNGGFIPLTDIPGNGDLYPAAATNLTSYVPANQSAYINAYRTGASLPAETVYITVTGYLTAN